MGFKSGPKFKCRINSKYIEQKYLKGLESDYLYDTELAKPFCLTCRCLASRCLTWVLIDITPMVFNKLSCMCDSNTLMETCYVVVV